MADNFSLDDILAEIDAKKAMKSGEPSEPKAREAKSAPKKDLSVTSIIGEDELSAALKEAEALKEKDKTSTPSRPKKPKKDYDEYKAQKSEKPSPVKEHRWEQSRPEDAFDKAEKSDKKERGGYQPEVSQKSDKKSAKGKDVYSKPQSSEYTEEAEVYSKPKKGRDKGGEIYAKRPKEKPAGRMIDRIAEKIAVKVDEEAEESYEEKADSSAFASQTEEKPVSEAVKAEEQTEKREETEEDAPVFSFKPKKPARQPEYDTQQRKLIDRQLKAEETFENPEELIDAINPYDVKSKAADPAVYLGGDTQGIAGNELKRLAEEGKKPSEKEEILLNEKTVKLVDGKDKWEGEVLGNTIEKTSPVKQYIPKKEKELREKDPDLEGTKIIKPTLKEKRSNDALLEKLNLALAKTHSEEEEKKRTAGLSLNATETGSVKAPTNGLNLDDGRVIMATGVLSDEDKLLKGKAKRKLRDFVMDADNDEEEEEEEFDNYDSTGEIWSDLCESHKVIKTRLVLLLIITLFMGIVGLMNDLGKGIVFNFFGADVTFLNKVENVQGYLFYNLIGGVIACGICASVLSNGLTKLFRLKADCDSVCAVTAFAAIVSAVVNIIRSDDVLLGQAFVYIPAAVAGLMFNTLGKLTMIKRAKRNFRFISGDSAKYSAILVEDEAASALTKGIAGSVPVLAAMRKTELLTDFLKSSYGEDKSDRISKKLVPIALGSAILIALISFLIPYGAEGLQNDIYRAVSVFAAILTAASPFAVMFVTNLPLTRAGLGIAKTDSVILGYGAAEEFSEVNSVMTDAALLFPAGTVTYTNIKHFKQPNSVNNIALDQAIILAASLAIKSGSVMSNMFKDMINDKEDILVKVENCVYEDNMGILGWYGTKRMIMGSRDQMKRHDIKVPDMKKVSKYAGDNTETIYLSVGGEIVIMFFVELMANPEVKNCLQELTDSDVSIVIKTTDSIVTVAKIAEVFEIPPEKIRILPYSMHEQFNHYTKYVSRGSGAVSCNGTFTGFAKPIVTAKRLMKDITLGMGIMLLGALLGVVCGAAAALTGNMQLLSSSMVMGWNLAWLAIAEAAQCFRRY
ncbi:MAG: hypothetical protein NC203_05365 [Firmicutes bacterium]|nr:hypothetical protein [[Eubacterium] siraeum]MCM1487780.1 hypothetical protein [Bacillota bacterium]